MAAALLGDGPAVWHLATSTETVNRGMAMRLTLSRTKTNGLVERSATFAHLSFLTTCSDDSKPYMILKGLDESYKNHIGFAIIGASDEEWQALDYQLPSVSRVKG